MRRARRLAGFGRGAPRSRRAIRATLHAAIALAAIALAVARAQERLDSATALAADTLETAASPTSDWRTLVGGAGPEAVPVRPLDGFLTIGVNDLARLLDATKFWRPDLRKLELRARDHRIQLTVDNPFVVVDDRTFLLATPIRSQGGELVVPIALIDLLPRDSLLARLHYDTGRRAVVRVPRAGIVGSPRVDIDGGITRVSFPAERPAEAVVAGRARAHFRIRMSGLFAGSLPATFPPGGLVRSLRQIPTAGGSAFELEVDAEAAGFRLDSDLRGGRAILTFDRGERAGLERFAPEAPAGPRVIRAVALDPGHGGADAGVVAPGVTEEDLTLRLARLLKVEIERRLGARVVLTREEDRDVSVEERAERANREHADLFISLHFDGLPGSRAQGATAYCPPAIYGASPEEAGATFIPLVPWRDVALRHAVLSRELSESLLSALELRAQGPTRLREILPYALLGVNAPGVLLECAMLTSDTDRARVTSDAGLADLAATIASGIEAYQRNE